MKTQLVLSLAITETPMPAERYRDDGGRAGEGDCGGEEVF